MQDRPAAPALVDAVRAFLQEEIIPTLADQRLRFRALIAANVLSVVERELAAEDGVLPEEWRRLAALCGQQDAALPGSTGALRTAIAVYRQDLCARIRAGEADEGPWAREVWAYARWSVRAKLVVANPRYLARTEESSRQ